MKTITYNKLVRDNIPEIIERSGKSFTTEILNDEDYKTKLKEKLIEEAKEVSEANGSELAKELADVLETVDAIEKTYGINSEDVLSVKENKANKNGKFDKKILLKEVIEND